MIKIESQSGSVVFESGKENWRIERRGNVDMLRLADATCAPLCQRGS